jgi:diguanylate cyclase (GGDEF)-like protein
LTAGEPALTPPFSAPSPNPPTHRITKVIRVLQRLRHSSQLRLISALGLSTAVFMLGFALYRLLNDQYLAAIVDASLSVAICIPVFYALLTGNTKRAGIALCVIDSLFCIIVSWAIGPVAVYWHYLVLVTNFFIVTPKLALVCNTIVLVSMLAIIWPQQAAVTNASIAASATLLTCFTYFFALRNNVDRDMLEEIASLDALTGMPNRRTMERCLTEALERHRTQRISYGLIILDIDHFKQVNDSYGHAAGDAVLADLSAILKHHMRKRDQVFRFGGEEFVVLVEVGTTHDLRLAAERIRLGIRGALRGPGGRITVSAGAALLGQEDNWQEWFSLADSALYRAKNRGRDQSMLLESEAEEASIQD